MDIKEFQWFISFLIKNWKVVALNLCAINNFPDGLHKPIIKSLKEMIYSSFKDNIWTADITDMQLTSKHSKGIRFLLCVIDLFSKYKCFFFFKRQKGYYYC